MKSGHIPRLACGPSISVGSLPESPNFIWATFMAKKKICNGLAQVRAHSYEKLFHIISFTTKLWNRSAFFCM